MRVVCPNQEELDVWAAELRLTRDNTGRDVYIQAYLVWYSEGDEDDLVVQTDPFTVPVGDPLELSAATILCDSGLLRVFMEELLNTFPWPCACSSGGECFALGSQDILKAALRKVGGK